MTIREIVTLLVFTGFPHFYLGEALHRNHFSRIFFIVIVAAFFIIQMVKNF